MFANDGDGDAVSKRNGWCGAVGGSTKGRTDLVVASDHEVLLELDGEGDVRIPALRFAQVLQLRQREAPCRVDDKRNGKEGRVSAMLRRPLWPSAPC